MEEVKDPRFSEFLKRHLNFKITIDPTIKSDQIKINPKKTEDAERIIGNLKGPLPWDPNNPY